MRQQISWMVLPKHVGGWFLSTDYKDYLHRKLEVAVASFQFLHALSKIRPLPRNHTPYTALGLLHVANVTRYQVQVHVINGLAGSATDVDADVEPVRVEALTDDGCHIVEQLPAGGLLNGGKPKITAAMPPGDHQHVAWIHRIFIEDGESSAGFEDGFGCGIGMGEGAGRCLLTTAVCMCRFFVIAWFFHNAFV